MMIFYNTTYVRMSLYILFLVMIAMLLSDVKLLIFFSSKEKRFTYIDTSYPQNHRTI